MTLGEIIKFIDNWAKQFEQRLSELVEGLDIRVQGMQRDMMQRLIEAVSVIFSYESGVLTGKAKNMAAIRKLEGIFDAFFEEVVAKELELFAKELLEVGDVTAGYFQATTDVRESAIADALRLMRTAIGIADDGTLAKDGYLYRLGKSPEAREEIRRYMVQSIVSKRSLKELQEGLKVIVLGSDDVDGFLQRYWRQYAYDTYNQAHEIVNSTVAGSLGMEHFIYQGSIIATSRSFCRKRAGNVYTVEETKEWKDDPDLIDKKTKDAYNPIIERGRYNCRHFINWITKELAEQLRPDLKK